MSAATGTLELLWLGRKEAAYFVVLGLSIGRVARSMCVFG